MSSTLASPTETVHRGPDGRVFSLRACADLDELDQCVALQQQAWGYPDREVVPRNMYVLAQALGGHVLAAWHERAGKQLLAGFAMAIAAHEPAPGIARHTSRWMRPIKEQVEQIGPVDEQVVAQPAEEIPPTPYLHSHMLAVAPAYQNSGLGFALKLAQRQQALARSIRVMRWTFDPLMAKNAYFNLYRLGATAGLYIENFYGRLGSALQGGLPTDRLVAEWQLDADRVALAIDRQSKAPERILKKIQSIALPAALATWKERGAQAEAEAMQRELRTRFQEAFARGLRVEDFLPAPDGGGAYLLAAPASGKT